MVEHMLDSLHLIKMVFIMIRMMRVLMMAMVREKELTTPWLATMLATLATTSFPALLLSSVGGEGKKNRDDDDLAGTKVNILQ